MAWRPSAVSRAVLGDGEGLYGFHQVIRDGVFAYAIEHDARLDPEPLKQDIRRRIDAARKGANR